MEFQRVDLDTINATDLLKVIEDNIKTATIYKENIKKMQAASTKIKKTLPSVNTHPVQELYQEPKPSKENDFEDEVDYYLSQLKELTPENLESRIYEALPVRKNHRFKNIILRMKLESIKNVNEIEEVLEEDDLTPEDKDELYKEMSFEKRKITLLDQELQEKETDLISQEENRIIFVPTLAGNIRVIDEIEHIPSEYYEGFIKLFDSIKDGTFKGVKRFKNNNALAGVSEIKDFKIRVVFLRLDRNSYAVITAFTKKNDNDNGYLAPIKSKVAEYRTVATALRKNLSNEEFINQQKEYEQELYRILGASENKKGQTLVKGAK